MIGLNLSDSPPSWLSDIPGKQSLSRLQSLALFMARGRWSGSRRSPGVWDATGSRAWVPAGGSINRSLARVEGVPVSGHDG